MKRLSVGFLVLAMLMPSGSMNILASNVSIGNGTTADVEEQVANENDGEVADLEGVGSDSGTSLFGAVPTYNVGDTLYFGRYPQTTTDANFLEPIKWRVLSNDGSKALLISDKTLDFKHYHNTAGSITWATCDLRNWLNTTFYNKAFDSSEKAAIKKETISSDGSIDTEDNVFLLSGSEASSLFSNDNDRICLTTFYTRNVELNGAKLTLYYNYSTSWWLRGERWDDTQAAIVSYSGVANAGIEVEDIDNHCAVRPAIYIDLTSAYCTANESSVTYNLDGGDWVKDNTTWKELTKYKEGVVNTLPTANDIKKDGYVLKGWYINGGDLLQTFINETWTGSLTLKAVWTPEGSRDLTDRENAAFIVRDEWTSWVKSFTNELSELDKNATSRIYSNMDFYDMQYRFTEKYKKVPEYLDEDGKPTQKLKDMIKDKRKEIAGGSKKIKDYLKFTSNQNGSTVKFTTVSTTGTLYYDMGYSKDGTTFTKWNANEVVTLNAGEYIYVHNKTETLSRDVGIRLRFNMSGSIAASGNVMSMLNFAEEVPTYAFYGLFAGCSALTSAPELPATTISNSSYQDMFSGCTSLKEAPELPAVTVPSEAYARMFDGCTSLEKGPYIKLKTCPSPYYALNGMFRNCTNLNYIKLDYTEEIYFGSWVQGVTATGTLYYNGPTTAHNNNQIPTNFTVERFTE